MDFMDEFADSLEEVPENFFDRERFVPGAGNLDADVVLLGEAPGANEVKQGKPFVGRAGKVLDEILEDIEVERSELYITNLVKVRPPDNRDPKPGEIEAWKPLLDAEMERVGPDTVVTMGNFASKEMVGTSKGISRIHGKVFTRDGRRILPTFHPAATLYDPDKRPALEKDLLKSFGKPERGQTTLGDV